MSAPFGKHENVFQKQCWERKKARISFYDESVANGCAIHFGQKSVDTRTRSKQFFRQPRLGCSVRCRELFIIRQSVDQSP